MNRGGWVGFLFFVSLVIMGFSTLLIQNKSGNFFGKSHVFTVRFDHVQGLRSGNDVLVDGLILGRVEKITLAAGSSGVIAELSLNRDVELFEDSKVLVESTSVLGNNIVSITRGSKNPLKMSSTFTSANPYTGAVRAGFAEAGDLIGENRENIRQFVLNLKEVSENLKDTQGSLGKLIKTDELHKEAVDTVKAARETISEARIELKRVGDTITDSLTKLTNKISDKLDKAEGPAGALLNDKTLTVKLDRIVTHVDEASQNLKEITDSIKKGDGALGKMVNDKEMGEKFKATVDNLERVSESMKNVGTKLETGEGSVGKLLQDDELYEQAHRALDDVERLLGRASHMTVEIVGDYKDYLGTRLTITKAGLRISSDDDKYFQASAALLGLNKLGTIQFTQQALNENATVFKPDIFLAYRAPWLLDHHLTVRGGYIEGKPGGGLDFTWSDWGCFSYPVRMTFEMRDSYRSVAREGIDELIHGSLMRAYLKIPLSIRSETWLEKLLSTVRLSAGINRIGNTPELLAGISLEWPDEDIRSLVSLISTAR